MIKRQAKVGLSRATLASSFPLFSLSPSILLRPTVPPLTLASMSILLMPRLRRISGSS